MVMGEEKGQGEGRDRGIKGEERGRDQWEGRGPCGRKSQGGRRLGGGGREKRRGEDVTWGKGRRTKAKPSPGGN